MAVALVTLNRVDDPRYPKSICGVVYQKYQFSWTKGYKKGKVNTKQWEESRNMALAAFLDRNILGKFKATHFHAKKINPRWKLRRVAVIGQHIFYR